MSDKWVDVTRTARRTGECQCPAIKGKELGVCRAPITVYMTRDGAKEQLVCDYHRDILLENGWDESRDYEE